MRVGPPATAGDGVITVDDGSQNPQCWLASGADSNATAALQLIAVCEAANVSLTGLCLSLTSDSSQPLVVDQCETAPGKDTPAHQNFQVVKLPNSGGNSAVVHVPTGACLTAPQTPGTVR